MEHFIAWYSRNQYEWFAFFNRATGPYARRLLADDVLQRASSRSIFWFKKARTNIPVMWIAAIFVNIGMWCERFVIIVTSLHRDFLPVRLGHVRARPGWTGRSSSAPSGFFGTLFLLFLKFLPAVAVSEVKELQRGAPAPPAHGHRGHGARPMEHATERHAAPVGRPTCSREFATGEALVEAGHKVREKGFEAIDTYSPVPAPRR